MDTIKPRKTTITVEVLILSTSKPCRLVLNLKILIKLSKKYRKIVERKKSCAASEAQHVPPLKYNVEHAIIRL